MKAVRFIPDTGGSSDVFYIAEPWTLAVSGNRTWTIQLRKASDSSVLESYVLPLGAGSWNLSFAGVQRGVEFDYLLFNSATATTYYQLSSNITFPDQGYSEAIGVTVAAL